MSEVILYANAVAGIESGNPTIPPQATSQLACGNWGGHSWVSFLKFDFSGLSSLNIASVSLNWFYEGTAHEATNSISINAYMCKRNWDWSSMCWNYYTGTSAWGTAGCANSSTDYDSTLLGTLNLTTSSTTLQYYNISIQSAMVSSMINGTYANYGFVFRATAFSSNFYIFDGVPGAYGYNPFLTINYNDVVSSFLPGPIWL
jgi:hypothetical protein